MELVLLGPPGSGKGTQAKVLAGRLNIPHVSTGDLFRNHLAQGTELGLLAKKYMDEGTLVPDGVTEAMVKARLAESDAGPGFICDGFPRNLVQGEHFDHMLAAMGRELTQVIYLVVPRSMVIERLTGRRVCAHCGALYHVALNPPKTAGVCDRCGGQLVQRRDDSEETVLRRLQVYEDETAPLVGYYQSQSILAEFDGTGSAEDVTNAIAAGLESSRG
jgi:adenylate kinase